MIDIKNVSKWYGSFQVLTDCTTSIQKGEVVVVCGPSGSGKSTLIKTVNALEPFQKGDIIVSVNNQKIARTSDLEKATRDQQRVWRITLARGGQQINVTLGG